MRTDILPVLAVLLVGVACGNDIAPKSKGPVDVNNSTAMDAGAGDTNSPTPDLETVVPDATMSSEDAPTIIELGATPNTITENGSTVISAIVTDPQGVEDIVAGRLFDSQTQDLVGNFQNIGGGSFELQVTWSTLDQIRPITFGTGGSSRAFTAEFIDNSNERSTQSIALQLTCEGGAACEGACGRELCDGECVNPDLAYSDIDNCGSCGNTCGANEFCDVDTCATGGGVNGPCTDQSQCSVQGALCLTEAQAGVPNGVCVVLCSDSSECPGSSECVFFFTPETGEVTLCGEPCTSSAECRSTWSCGEVERVDGVFDDYCAPVGGF